jgi:hypothetical protein
MSTALRKPVQIAIKHREEIISRLAAGELVSHIAASLGCHRMSISAVLANDPEYRAAFDESLESRLDMATEAIDEAQDVLSLARAREHASMSRWRAERLLPHKYGQRGAQVNINLNRDPAAMTDAELVQRLD